MKKTLLTLFTLSLSASWLPAKEINFPDSANWIISFDVKTFHESRMGKFIMGKMSEDPNVNQKMQGLKNAFGVDLLKIREISAFGSGEKDKGTAIISGGINSKQLEGFASLNDKVEIDKVGYPLQLLHRQVIIIMIMMTAEVLVHSVHITNPLLVQQPLSQRG